MHIVLIYFAIKYNGNWDLIYQALEKKEKIPVEEMKKTEEQILREKWNLITILDSDYPNKLKTAYKPPFVLWCKGDKDILKEKLITISGNELDVNSQTRIKNFLPKVLEKCLIITASFKGVDEKVIEQSEEKPVVFVLANGLNKPYINGKTKSNDLFISEYPPESVFKKEHVSQRNRIISAFGEALVLINSKKNSGINSLITNFLNLGKDVYCFPGDGSLNDGNSHLIKQGAHLITQVEDLNI